MLKSVQSVLSKISNQTKKDLVNKQVYGIKRESRTKQLKKRIKYCEARPHLFQKKSRMNPPDLTQDTLTFPINIPIKFSYVYRPVKNKLRLPTHDFINFKNMTGNQILLHLEKPEDLRESELCSALIELSKRNIDQEFDWNQHEWIQGTVDNIKSRIHNFNASSVSYITLGLHRLKIEDVELWDHLEYVVDKTMHKFTPKGYAYNYIAFLENKRGSEEFREKMSLRLPIFLHKLNPLLMSKCFEVTVQNKLMNEHLFENHFLILFGRRVQWFGATYPTIIDGLVELDHRDDSEFWNDIFLPSVKKINFKTESQVSELIVSLQNLQDRMGIDVDQYVQFLEEKLNFMSSTVQAIENAKFYNVVMNDIEYYRQKEQLKLQKQQQEE